jgi:hypothetical protein
METPHAKSPSQNRPPPPDIASYGGCCERFLRLIRQPCALNRGQNMLRKMIAEVIFLNPNDLNRGSAELIERDFEVEFLEDWIDEYSGAVWIKAWTLSELDDFSFFDWVTTIVEPVGGDVVEAGLA